MAPRSMRSKSSKATPEVTATENVPVRTLRRTENEQQRLFILPRNLSTEARVITLPNPATSTPCRYVFCPDTGLSEFTRIAAPKASPSTWLIAREASKDHERPSTDEGLDSKVQHADSEAGCEVSDGYVLEDASLFVATPIDPLFFLAPLFAPLCRGEKALFRMEDDHIDVLSEGSVHMRRMLRRSIFRCLLLKRLEAASQIQNLGCEKVFKPDLSKFVTLLMTKAKSMSQDGTWPASMEEAFVRQQVEVPVPIVARANPQLPTPELSQDTSNPEGGSEGSQDVIDGHEQMLTTDLPSQAGLVEVLSLMRLKVAFNFILSSYIPAQLRPSLQKEMEQSALVDFQPLNEHLQRVQAAKVDVQVLRSLSDNISRKRPLDDDEAVEARAEKKRKKEEEDKRKAAETRAIKQLKKVDTTGMKKMSSFFSKAPPTAKKGVGT